MNPNWTDAHKREALAVCYEEAASSARRGYDVSSMVMQAHHLCSSEPDFRVALATLCDHDKIDRLVQRVYDVVLANTCDHAAAQSAPPHVSDATGYPRWCPTCRKGVS